VASSNTFAHSLTHSRFGGAGGGGVADRLDVAERLRHADRLGVDGQLGVADALAEHDDRLAGGAEDALKLGDDAGLRVERLGVLLRCARLRSPLSRLARHPHACTASSEVASGFIET
jgi:hypothetical protein